MEKMEAAWIQSAATVSRKGSAAAYMLYKKAAGNPDGGKFIGAEKYPTTKRRSCCKTVARYFRKIKGRERCRTDRSSAGKKYDGCGRRAGIYAVGNQSEH